ncbi:hypothetical protein AAV28_37725 [Bradyrhizobium diazoefficiens USDA 110]|nr:hypothetical protein AAV28_37725 [Bradyrhizobium diazoefficiens USDA 110]
MRRDWKDDARAALDSLSTVPHGEREKEMQRIALQLKKHKDTTALRRSIFAYEFWRSLADPEPVLHAHLADAPLSIVEVIARWYTFDRTGAREAVERWSRGVGTVRSITDEMQARRPKGFYGRTGLAFEREYAAAAEPGIVEAVRLVIGRPVSVVAKGLKSPGGVSVDFVLATKDGEPTSIAVLIVGPYTNAKNYITKSADWVGRAYGLAWLYDVVVLAVPSETAVADFDAKNSAMRREIAELKTSDRKAPQVLVASLFVDPFSEEDHGALARLSP